MVINPDTTESPMKFKGKSQTSLCYCGHDCARCITYIATQRNDNTLRRQSQNFYKESFGLDLPLHEFNCSGGRSDRVFKPAENVLLSGAASGITSIPVASARNTRAKRFQIIRKSM